MLCMTAQLCQPHAGSSTIDLAAFACAARAPTSALTCPRSGRAAGSSARRRSSCTDACGPSERPSGSRRDLAITPWRRAVGAVRATSSDRNRRTNTPPTSCATDRAFRSPESASARPLATIELNANDDFHLPLQLGDEPEMLDRAVEALEEVEPGETVFLPEYVAWTAHGSGARVRPPDRVGAGAEHQHHHHAQPRRRSARRSARAPIAPTATTRVVVFTRHGVAHVPQAKISPQTFEMDDCARRSRDRRVAVCAAQPRAARRRRGAGRCPLPRLLGSVRLQSFFAARSGAATCWW